MANDEVHFLLGLLSCVEYKGKPIIDRNVLEEQNKKANEKEKAKEAQKKEDNIVDVEIKDGKAKYTVHAGRLLMGLLGMK